MQLFTHLDCWKLGVSIYFGYFRCFRHFTVLYSHVQNCEKHFLDLLENKHVGCVNARGTRGTEIKKKTKKTKNKPTTFFA